MISSVTVAGLIAAVAFWVIVALGIAFGEIGRKGASIALILWAAGFFGLPRLLQYGGAFVAPYVAVLDIVLAIIVFKGDVQLR